MIAPSVVGLFDALRRWTVIVPVVSPVTAVRSGVTNTSCVATLTVTGALGALDALHEP